MIDVSGGAEYEVAWHVQAVVNERDNEFILHVHRVLLG
jgi:hypothetical protein